MREYDSHLASFFSYYLTSFALVVVKNIPWELYNGKKYFTTVNAKVCEGGWRWRYLLFSQAKTAKWICKKFGTETDSSLE